MMKKYIILLLFSIAVSSVAAQTYQRHDGEHCEVFMERIKPDRSTLVHPVIETTWNSDEKVIIAFWDTITTPYNNNYEETTIVGWLFVPVKENEYRRIKIDSYRENPMPAQIVSVMFYDTDDDGTREMIVIYANEYRHYMMGGTFYEAAVYKDIDYNNLPEKLFCIEDIDGGVTGNNEEGEEFAAFFSNVSELKAYLNKREKPRWWDLNNERTLTGVIGDNMEVSFTIKRRHRDITGFYYYKSTGTDIELTGHVDGQNVEFQERDYKRAIRADITGRFTEGGFTGEWKDRITAKTYPVSLTLSPFTEQALPDDITGIYKTESEYCPMQVEIKKEQDIYTYTMTTPSGKEFNGQAAFQRPNSEDSIFYITFPDVKWAENRGNLNTGNDDDKLPESLETSGIDAVWDDGNIIIQNTGNAMNYYVKIADCGDKFIELKKERK